MSKSLSIPSKRWFSTATKHRVYLRNPKTATQVAEAFVPAGTKKNVVIEAFPGMANFLDTPLRWTDSNSCRTWNIDACLVTTA